MGLYPARAVERALKIQEVILRAVAGEILWSQAAEIIGVTDRSMRRWRQRYEEYGYDGLYDRRLKRPSPKKVPLNTVEKVLRLYREQYFDFNVRHYVEKLHAEHGVELSYTWVKTALQMAGLVTKSRKRGKHRKKRPRRPLPGKMLHVDGSTHCWLGDAQRHDLVAILDDATSEVYYAQLVDQESTATVMAGLKEVVEQKGSTTTPETLPRAVFPKLIGVDPGLDCPPPLPPPPLPLPQDVLIMQSPMHDNKSATLRIEILI